MTATKYFVTATVMGRKAYFCPDGVVDHPRDAYAFQRPAVARQQAEEWNGLPILFTPSGEQMDARDSVWRIEAVELAVAVSA